MIGSATGRGGVRLRGVWTGRVGVRFGVALLAVRAGVRPRTVLAGMDFLTGEVTGSSVLRLARTEVGGMMVSEMAAEEDVVVNVRLGD